jgi:hypothetical protein
MGSLRKGSYVRCKNQDRAGVVSDTRASGFAYIRWMTDWNPEYKVVKHYLEFVSITEVVELPADGIHPGLVALRQITLR